MNIIPNAPKFSPCWYCKSEVEGSHNSETSVRYTCLNHKPLHIEWNCQRRTVNEWYFNNIIILLPDHFRLFYPIMNDEVTEFYLDEFKRTAFNNYKGAWIDKGKTYPVEWVLSQTPERLLSLLQMYKTFS